MSHLPNINKGIVGKRCSACGHERQSTDRAPRHRCPKCGEAYYIVQSLRKRTLVYDDETTVHLPEGNPIDFVVKELRDRDDIAENIPSATESRQTFYFWMRKIIRLGKNEPLLLLFGALQYIIIGLFFGMWIVGYTFTSIILTSLLAFDILLLISLWTILCIYLASLPISVINACMACVHFLHQQDTKPSIRLCLSIVMPNARNIWRLQYWDNRAALLRFVSGSRDPGYAYDNPRRQSHMYLFYIWRLGSSGVLAGLLAGRSLEYSARKSIEFVIRQHREVALIVMGLESLRDRLWVMCLLIAVGCGGFAIAYATVGNPEALIKSLGLMALLLFAVTLVYQVLIKPTYLISLCELHFHHVNEEPAATK